MISKHPINRYIVNTKQLGEILFSRDIFTKLANWPLFLLAYLGIAPQEERVIWLSSGVQLTVNLRSTDKWSIHEIVLRDDYGLSPIANDCKTIIDLGANIGVFAVYAASLNPNTKVYAFEPHPDNYSRMLENIQNNNLEGRVLSFAVACASNDAGRTFYITRDHRSHSFSTERSKNTMLVKTKSLEQIFQENNIAQCDLLKMDIEGAEYEILYSTPSQILAKIRYITMEYHNLNPATGKTGKDLKEFLQNHGFAVEQKESLQHAVGQIFAANNS